MISLHYVQPLFAKKLLMRRIGWLEKLSKYLLSLFISASTRPRVNLFTFDQFLLSAVCIMPYVTWQIVFNVASQNWVIVIFFKIKMLQAKYHSCKSIIVVQISNLLKLYPTHAYCIAMYSCWSMSGLISFSTPTVVSIAFWLIINWNVFFPVVNLTMIDLPGLTKVAVGMLSFYFLKRKICFFFICY